MIPVKRLSRCTPDSGVTGIEKIGGNHRRRSSCAIQNPRGASRYAQLQIRIAGIFDRVELAPERLEATVAYVCVEHVSIGPIANVDRGIVSGEPTER